MMDPLHACTVVLDNGSGTLRAGFGNSDRPALIMPSVVGRPKLPDECGGTAMADKATSAEAPADQGQIFFGDDAVLANPDTVRRSYPVCWGLVQDWENLTKLWKHVFEQKLGVREMEKTPLVVMESAYMVPKIHREKLTELAFETFNVPRFYLANTPSAVLRSMGVDTGLVIDIGRDNVRVVPVYEGFYIPHAVMKFEIGGQNVTDSLLRLLSQKGTSPVPCFQEAMLMKEELAYVAQDYEEEQNTFTTSKERSFTLSSGELLSLGQERFQCVESLFQPALSGVEMLGLAEHTVLTVFKCAHEIRQALLSNVVLVGGGSKLPGMATRLQHDVQRHLRGHEDPALHGLRVHVLAPPPADGDLTVWQAGSSLVRDPEFADLCISKGRYDECGPWIVHRKCL